MWRKSNQPQDRDQWQDLGNKVISLQVPQKASSSSTRWM